MASTFTDLGLELMATGENAGTWGNKTNANLNLIEQLTGGVNSQAVTDSGTPTALTIADGALTGTAQHRVIELTGSISGNRIVTFPLLTETFYIIKNGTTGSHTVQLKAVSGSGATVTFSATNKGYKLIYLDGVSTNTGVFEAPLGEANEVTLTGTETLTNKTLTDPKLSPTATTAGKIEFLEGTNNGTNKATLIGPAATADVTVTLPAATDTLIGKATTDTLTNKTLTNPILTPTASTGGKIEFLEGTNNGTNKVTLIGPPSSADVTVTLPAATDTLVGKATTDILTNKTINASQLINATVSLAKLSNGTDGNLISYDANGAAVAVATGNAAQVLTSAGAGAPPVFADAAGGGTDWQAIKTANFTAAAGQGVFCNTSGGSFTLTLPSSPSLGDEVSFVDYAGTFDSNALTIGRNSQPIQGAASNLTVSVERAANTLVYVDGTQGWLLKNK